MYNLITVFVKLQAQSKTGSWLYFPREQEQPQQEQEQEEWPPPNLSHMSQFPQPQHKFAAALDSGTFGSIIIDPYMMTLDPPFYIWKIQAWKERIFVVLDFLMD